jgi:hypothetical protein
MRWHPPSATFRRRGCAKAVLTSWWLLLTEGLLQQGFRRWHVPWKGTLDRRVQSTTFLKLLNSGPRLP